jgi:hypothetical protein
MNKIIYLITLLFISLTFTALGNNTPDKRGYSQGYIITNENDTLVGLVKDRTGETFTKIYKKVRLKNGGLFPKRFSASKIKKYCHAGGCYESIWMDLRRLFIMEAYVSRKGYGEKVFMKVAIDGYLTLYYLEFIDGESGNPDYIELFKRKDDDYLIRVKQGVFLRKQALIGYFYDCPELVEQIEKNELKKPADIVSFYNSYYNSFLK